METASHLVTGGCGLQGTHIVRKLREQFPNASVAVMARNPTVNLVPGVTYHAGDVTSPEDVARVFAASRPTVVYHCAGLMTAARAMQSDAVVRAINLDGTRIVLDESRRPGSDVRAFVFTSSASVVQRENGGITEMQGGDESLPTAREGDNTGVYQISKSEAERLVLAADSPPDADSGGDGKSGGGGGGGMRTCSIRPAIIYGEFDNDVIPNLVGMLRAGRNRVQMGDGTNRVSVTYGGNSADAHLLAAARLLGGAETARGVGGEAFFVTNAEPPVPFWAFARAIWRAAGDRTPPDQVRVVSVGFMLWLAWLSEWYSYFAGTRPAMTRFVIHYTALNRWFDTRKARERLGYKPAVEWEEGVRRGVKWFLENEEKKKKQQQQQQQQNGSS